MSALLSAPIVLGLVIMLPRILEAFRVPMPITALVLGVLGASLYALEDIRVPTDIVGTVAVTMLFLFAGLEVDLAELRRDWKLHSTMGAAHLAVIALLSMAAMGLFLLPLKTAAILAIGLVTPSAGFILDSIGSLKFSTKEKSAVATGAIGLEVTSLLALVVVLGLDDPGRIAIVAACCVLAFTLVPMLWRLLERTFFAKVPRAEFVSIFMLAMLFSYGSKALGLYYIFGAFATGMILAKLNQDEMRPQTRDHMKAIELIVALFLPIYFFRAGAQIPLSSITLVSVLVGIGFLLTWVLRAMPILLARTAIRREPWFGSAKIAMALAPTLVFGLVIAEMLAAQEGTPAWVVGAVIIHTLLVTILPSIVLHSRIGELDPYHSKAELRALFGEVVARVSREDVKTKPEKN